jgi:hypothetical protein
MMDEQNGCHKGRSYLESVFAIKQIVKKRQLSLQSYIIFTDYKKDIPKYLIIFKEHI